MLLNEAYQKVVEELYTHPSTKKDLNTSLLSLNESIAKIWEAVENNKTEKIKSRAAGALISVFYVMKELGIENPEKCLIQKLEELRKDK